MQSELVLHSDPKTMFKDIVKHEFFKKEKEILNDDEICRICKSPATICIIANKIEELDVEIITAIRYVANISICETDTYPKYICKICIDELIIAFKFKKKCECADTIFHATNSQVVPGTNIVLYNPLNQKHGLRNLVKNEDYQNEFSPEQLIEGDEDYILKTVKKSKKAKQKKFTAHIDLPKLNSDEINIHNLKSSSRKQKLSKKSSQALKCKRCDLEFYSKEELSNHRKKNDCVHHACPLCGKLVLNLANHQRVVHLKTKEYNCHQCGKIYYSSGGLANHMQAHKETKEYFCEHCPYRGKRKSYLVCHMRQHTGERRYLCSLCPLSFSNSSNWNKHQLVHYSKKFKCPKCSRDFRQEKHLKDHFDSAHLNIRYRCSICGKDLSSRKKLLSHEICVHKREKHKLFGEMQTVVTGQVND